MPEVVAELLTPQAPQPPAGPAPSGALTVESLPAFETQDAESANWQHAGFAVEPPAAGPVESPVGQATKSWHASPSEVRPRRRLLRGLLVAVLAGYAGFFLWDSLFRTQAMGIVQADIVEIAAPAAGSIRQAVVAEGSRVQAGQVVASIDCHSLRDDLARATDELEIARAEVKAEASRVKWELEVTQDGRFHADAELHREEGNLSAQRALIERLSLTLARVQELKDRGSVTAEEFDRIRLELKGEVEKTARDQQAVGDMRRRSEMFAALVDQMGDRLKPKLARVTALESQVERLRERVAQLDVRAPLDGMVLKRHRTFGERVAVNDPLLTLAVDATREAVLFLPESRSGLLEPGDEVALCGAGGVTLHGTVAFVGESLQPSPENIETFYRRGERLLAVHVRPSPGGSPWPELPLGSVLKLSRFGGITRRTASR
jgi:multidrug resistance efflux pump